MCSWTSVTVQENVLITDHLTNDVDAYSRRILLGILFGKTLQSSFLVPGKNAPRHFKKLLLQGESCPLESNREIITGKHGGKLGTNKRDSVTVTGPG